MQAPTIIHGTVAHSSAASIIIFNNIIFFGIVLAISLILLTFLNSVPPPLRFSGLTNHKQCSPQEISLSR